MKKRDAVVLLHGYASSSQSRKAGYFRQRFNEIPELEFGAIDFNPTPMDFEYMTLTGLINRLRQFLLDRNYGKVSFIGSSLGALVGLHYAHRFGDIAHMLLLAPALAYVGSIVDTDLQRWEKEGIVKVQHYAFGAEVGQRYDIHLDGQRYSQPVSPPAPVVIVHGRHDEVVPIEASRRYAASYPNDVRLIEVDSDHRLNDQLDFIWKQVVSTIAH